MADEVDLAALRALTLVAELGSISAASGRLGVSQQAVSMRIRALEEQVHVPVLVRSARGSSLTGAGEIVVGWAAPLLAAADEYAVAAATLRAAPGGALRVAASLTIAEHLLPDWIARWRAGGHGQGKAARLIAMNSDAVVSAVREGTADLGFIETPVLPSGLGTLGIGRDRIAVVVPPDHPWASSDGVDAAVLAGSAFVLREAGSGTRRAFEDALGAAGTPLLLPPLAVHASTLGVRNAVVSGVGPGALSELAVRDDIRSGRLVRVRTRGVVLERPLTAVWRGTAPIDAAWELLAAIPGADRGGDAVPEGRAQAG